MAVTLNVAILMDDHVDQRPSLGESKDGYLASGLPVQDSLVARLLETLLAAR